MTKNRPEAKNLIDPPELPNEAVTEGLPDEQLYELYSYNKIVLSNCKLDGARGVTIEHAHFRNVQMSDEQFPRFDLRDVRFAHCDFANTEWDRASLTRVEFIGCRFLGFKVIKSRFKDVVIKQCHGKFAQFEFTKFKAVRFEHCVLEDTNFQDTDLANVVFLNCDLRNAMLFGAKLPGTDWRGSQIENLQVSLEQLRGGIFDPLQAVSILQRYAGVIVKSSEKEEETM